MRIKYTLEILMLCITLFILQRNWFISSVG